MTRQALYRLEQIALGNCGRGCHRARWGTRTMCRLCTLRMGIAQRRRRRARANAQRREAA